MKPLTVGKKYPHSITTRGVTAVYYQLYKFGHRLYIYLNSISEDTASKFRDGQLEFALFHQENVFILLLRVVKMEFPHSSDPAEHTLIEMDAPFCLYDVPEIWRPDTSDAIDGMAMRVVLIDVTNNMGRAFRITHTRGEGKFATRMQDAVASQLDATFSQEEYDRDLDRVYTKYPTFSELFDVAQTRWVAYQSPQPLGVETILFDSEDQG